MGCLDAVFRQGVDTPFPRTTFDDLEKGGSAENTILLDEEEDKENSPPPTTPVSERRTRPPALMKSCPFEMRKKISGNVFRNVFQ